MVLVLEELISSAFILYFIKNKKPRKQYIQASCTQGNWCDGNKSNYLEVEEAFIRMKVCYSAFHG